MTLLKIQAKNVEQLILHDRAKNETTQINFPLKLF